MQFYISPYFLSYPRRIEWEIAGQGEEETVMQKYQRLKCEMNHLMEEVQAIKVNNIVMLEILLILAF